MAPRARKKDASNSNGEVSGSGERRGKGQSVKSGGRKFVAVFVVGAAIVGLTAFMVSRKPAEQRRAPPPRRGPPARVWAAASAALAERLQENVTCAQRPRDPSSGPGEGACIAPRRESRCARFVVDDWLAEEDAAQLRDMVQYYVDEAWGGGSGPPSILDLQSGTISYNDGFIDLYQLMKFKSLKFPAVHVTTYHKVRKQLRRIVSDLFGISEELLLHDLTFYSHINASKEAQTDHDEYWHPHIDTEQYGTFAYTTLLYLGTEGKDFEGGEFVFEANAGGNGAKAVEKSRNVDDAIQPRFGRLVVFTSDMENTHRVEKVTDGVRITMTSAFTCNTEKAASLGKFPKSSEFMA
eukprot:TRINITY_DN50383_c0_g1_i1.p1 TRINITY_DN50383_c0_g1~~TRINITY_DN50383_c0_g1_i1.p1  ORF type:complete len:352 (+),score=67.48 TRINITY_DN50383_c0_g1_i1:101-1156(+)